MTSPLRETTRGFVLSVKATPQAARDEMGGIRNGVLLVKVTAAPEKGKANVAVIALLAKTMDIPKSAFVLISGETDRNKLFKLASHIEHVETWLQALERDNSNQK